MYSSLDSDVNVISASMKTATVKAEGKTVMAEAETLEELDRAELFHRLHPPPLLFHCYSHCCGNGGGL